MPIRPERRALYPPDWPEVRRAILERAEHRCEGSPSHPLCRARNHKPHPLTRSRVVLTIAHLDHNPRNCHDSNLRAWCQLCHNRYDVDYRRGRIKGLMFDLVWIGQDVPTLVGYPCRTTEDSGVLLFPNGDRIWTSDLRGDTTIRNPAVIAAQLVGGRVDLDLAAWCDEEVTP